MKTALFLLMFWEIVAAATPIRSLEPTDLSFNHQQNIEPFENSFCTHSKSNVGLFEWDVVCEVKGQLHTFGVHLAVSFYPKTLYGYSAYEVLYWVTDWTNLKHPISDSSTIWIHNTHPENRATVIEVFQGVENDNSSLRIKIKTESVTPD